MEKGKILAREFLAAQQAEIRAKQAVYAAEAEHRSAVAVSRDVLSKVQANNSALRARSAAKRQAATPETEDPPKKIQSICPVCRQPLKRNRAAHTNKTGRWCKGGDPPTEGQLDRAAKGKHVRTVSGGLPTLGRH